MISALFIQCSNSGVAWYRLTMWSLAAYRNKAFFVRQPYWDKSLNETHPWEVEITSPQHKGRIQAELDSYLKQADVVVCQMVHTHDGLDFVRAVKEAYKIPVVTEIDDHILSTPTYNPADAVYKPGSDFRAIAVEQFKISDAMVVSTPYLKEVYTDLNQNIHVVPNSLDFRTWDNLRFRKNTDFVRIGWAGGASHDEDLRLIEPVVRKTLEKHPTVRFCFVHGIPQFLRGIDRVEEVNEFTRIDRYPQFLASRSFDIGLAPLVDNAFNRAKSNLRWLEYAGLKVPCIASKVGHFAETITHEQDGLLCSNEQDWLDSISFLISDENARKKMGKAANQKARKDFNVDVNVHLYRKSLEEVVGKYVKPEPQEVTA